MIDCIDLQKQFGDTYRITWDPAHRPRESPDPWYAQIPCRFGLIYPHGQAMLAVEIDGHKNVVAQVKKVPGIVLHQDGDTEKTFLFPVDQFGAVAALVHPYRKRRLSEEQKARAVETLRAYQFAPGENRRCLGTVDAVDESERSQAGYGAASQRSRVLAAPTRSVRRILGEHGAMLTFASLV
jgi:hypothetical protein